MDKFYIQTRKEVSIDELIEKIRLGFKINLSVGSKELLSGEIISITINSFSINTVKGETIKILKNRENLISVSLLDTPQPLKQELESVKTSPIEKAEKLTAKKPSKTSHDDMFRKIDELLGEFKVKKIRQSKLTFRKPSFTFPLKNHSLSTKEKNEVEKQWDLVLQNFHQSIKTRNQEIIFEQVKTLDKLGEKYPKFGDFFHLAGYFYVVTGSGNFHNGLKFYEKAYKADSNPIHAYNIAFCALRINNPTKAHSALLKFFKQKLPTSDEKAWYAYSWLTLFLNEYRSMKKVFDNIYHSIKESDSTKKIHSNIVILVKTLLYFIRENNITLENRKIINIFRKNKIEFSKDLQNLITSLLNTLDKKAKGKHTKPEILTISGIVYKQIEEKEKPMKTEIKKSVKLIQKGKKAKSLLKGVIIDYRRMGRGGHGYLNKEPIDNEPAYWFHSSIISDPDLLERLEKHTFKKSQRIKVEYEIDKKEGKSEITNVILSNIGRFEIAKTYVSEGNYSKGVSLIKTVLDIDPNYPKAKSLLKNWYQKVKSQPAISKDDISKRSESEKLVRGKIVSYKLVEKNGFIYRQEKRKNYLFSIESIIDEELKHLLENNGLKKEKEIEVVFEEAKGSSGKIALRIERYKTKDQIFNSAKAYVEEGEYAKGASQLEELLSVDSDYPEAKELFEKWSIWAKTEGVPSGSSPYQRARRIELVEGSDGLEKAEKFYRIAIKENNRALNAVKNLSSLLNRKGEPDQAIALLKEYSHLFKDNPQQLENFFINSYERGKKWSEVIPLLEKKIKRFTIKEKDKRAEIHFQIARTYLKAKEYEKAEKEFIKYQKKYDNENKAAQFNIALTYLYREEYLEAEKRLNDFLKKNPNDEKALKILDVVKAQKLSLEDEDVSSAVDESIKKITPFTQNFLDSCKFENIKSSLIVKGEFDGTEKQAREIIDSHLEKISDTGTQTPIARSNYLLEAAILASDVLEDTFQFSRYLCRSLSSRGDAEIVKRKHLDVVRSYYCEALVCYDSVFIPRQKYDETDAINALCRFLYSYVGRDQIPTKSRFWIETKEMPTYKQQREYIREALHQAITQNKNREQVFDAIVELFNSEYAEYRLTYILKTDHTLKTLSESYLKKQGIEFEDDVRSNKDFRDLWQELRRNRLDNMNDVSDVLRSLTHMTLDPEWLEHAISQIKIIEKSSILYNLDHSRIMKLQKLYERIIEILAFKHFYQKEGLAENIKHDCQEILSDIEESPTKMSFELIKPAFISIQENIDDFLKDIPDPELKLVTVSDYYKPVKSQTGKDMIEFQIKILNEEGGSPVKKLELIIIEESKFFKRTDNEPLRIEFLGDGREEIVTFPLELTKHAIDSKTFDLYAFIQCITRNDEEYNTDPEPLPIHLKLSKKFIRIPNPYASHTQGKAVKDKRMFFGRREIIANIKEVFLPDNVGGRGLIIWGQRRSGKSTILYWLEQELSKEENILIVNMEDLGEIIQEDYQIQFEYHFVWKLLDSIKEAIHNREKNDYTKLSMKFPSDEDIYSHPNVILLLGKTIKEFKKEILKYDDWKNTRIIMICDEFTYLYDQLLKGQISKTFPQNWKALLSNHGFNVILAGQDMTPRFLRMYPNAFGDIKHEKVSYLKEDDAIKLIEEPIRDLESKESRYRGKEAIEYILKLTASSPYFIVIFCDRLVEYMNLKKLSWVSKANLISVKDQLVKGGQYLDESVFHCLYQSADTAEDAINENEALEVLTIIAKNSKYGGGCNYSTIYANISEPNKNRADDIIRDLKRRDVIEQERENEYKIRVGLFRDWLIENK